MFTSKFAKRTKTAGSFAKAVAADGGLLLIFSAVDPTGFVTAVQAVKLLGEALSGISELAKEAAEAAAKSGDAEQRVRKLFKLLALETYSAALREGFADFGQHFRIRAAKRVEAEEARLPECAIDTEATLHRLAAPVFDHLDHQLEILLAGEDPVTETQRGFVRRVRVAADRKIEFVAADSSYESVKNYLVMRAARVTGGAATSAGERAPAVVVVSEEIPKSRQSDSTANLGGAPSSARPTEPAPALIGRIRDLFQARFDAARREVDTGSCLLGLQQFETLVADIRKLDEPGLEDLLSRSIHNRAVALHNLRRDDEAAAGFEEALAAPGGATRTPIGRYLAKFCRRDFVGARAALKELTIEEHIRSAHEAECWLCESQPQRALDALVGVQSVAASLLRIHAFCELGMFAAAEEAGRDAQRTWPNDPQLIVAIAYPQARRLVDQLQQERGIRKRPTADTRRVLEESLAAYRLLRDATQKSAHLRPLYDALNWLGLISLSIGKEYDAISYFEEGLTRWVLDPVFLANKHFAQIRAGDYVGARNTAITLASVDWEEGVARRIAASLLARDFDDAKVALEDALQRKPDFALSDPRIASHALQIYRELKDTDRIQSWIDTLTSAPDPSVLTLVSCAESCEEIGDASRADSLFAQAELRAEAMERDIVRGARGMILLHRGEWAAAIHDFGRDGMDPIESHFADEILWCLVQLGDLPGAVALGSRMEASDCMTARGRRSMVAAYSRLKNEPEAERHASVLVEKLHPAASDFLNLFELRRRLRPLPEAIRVLETGCKTWPQSVEIRMMLAQVHAVAGNWHRSIQEAREVTRLAPGSETERMVWARYVVSKLPKGLATQDEERRIGESFAAAKNLLRIRVVREDGEFDPTEILALLKERARASQEVMDIYAKHQLPGSIVSNAMGFTPWSFWWRVTHERNHLWWMASGTHDEQEQELDLARKSTVVAMDYSALCTLAALRRLDIVPALFGKALVSAETRNVFADELQTLQATPPSAGTACYHEGRLVFLKADPTEHEEQRRLLRDIVDFLDGPSVTVVAPSPEVWEAHRGLLEGDDAKASFGAGVAVAYLAAKSHGAAIISDELGTRTLLGKEVGVSGLCTQALLRLACEKGVERNAHAAIEKLIELNYSFVSITDNFLERHMRENAYRRTYVTERLLREIVRCSYANRPGLFELGKAAALLWFYPEGWSRDEWIPIVRDQINGIGDSHNLYWFAVGIAVELRWFPSAVIALIETFVTDPLIAKGAAEKVKLGFHTIRRLLATRTEFEPMVLREWHDAQHWNLSFLDS